MDRIYLRGSDDRIDRGNQLADLRTVAAPGALVYEDSASGSKDRPELARLLAETRPDDVVWCWSVDRLSRQGVRTTLNILEALHAKGARVRSFRESWLDSSSPCWEVMVACLAFAAKMERDRLRERVEAGIRAKRAAAGRPVLDKVAIGRAPGSYGQVAKQFGCTRAYVQKCRAALRPSKPIAAPTVQTATPSPAPSQPTDGGYIDPVLGFKVTRRPEHR